MISFFPPYESFLLEQFTKKLAESDLRLGQEQAFARTPNS